MATETMTALKVVHLSSVHPPHDNRIFWKECLTLAGAGYGVSLVVCDAVPRWTASNQVAVISVRRRPGRFGRILISTVAVARAGLRLNADLYHFHDPELIPLGLLLRVLGKRVIYDVHEDLPRDILIKTWIPKRARSLVSWLAAGGEWLAGFALSGIVAATPAIACRFPADRTVLVQNFVRLSEFPAGYGPPQVARRAVAYIGSITEERCAFDMVAAIAGVERHPDVRVILAGVMSPPSLEVALADQPGWDRVDYRGYQNRAGVRCILADACAGLAVFYPVQSYIESQPTKLFEYMAAGLPVIVSDFPNFRAIVQEAACGICVPPRDISALSSAIEWILDHPAEAAEMGRRGRELFKRSFTWETQGRTLLDFYSRALGRLP